MTRILLFPAVLLLSFQLQAAGLASLASTEARREAALALIPIPWQELGYEIVFMPPQHGYRAMTFGRHKRIEIYARSGDDVLMLAHDIAHELGHAIDLTYNTQSTRAAWMAVRGISPETPWFGCARCSDYRTPSGDFAETFSLLLLGSSHFRGRIAPCPTVEQLPDLARFFESLGVPIASPEHGPASAKLTEP